MNWLNILLVVSLIIGSAGCHHSSYGIRTKLPLNNQIHIEYVNLQHSKETNKWYCTMKSVWLDAKTGGYKIVCYEEENGDTPPNKSADKNELDYVN